MGKNKFEFGSQVLIDLTNDTVESSKLAQGYTAHDRHGDIITGTAAVQLTPIEYDYNIGYVDNGTWKYENPTRTYEDIYEVQSGHTYFLTLGKNVGSRFRAMFTTTDIRTKTSGNVSGNNIINVNNPTSYRNVTYVAPNDGYILVAKDNAGKSGLYTYVYDIESWI